MALFSGSSQRNMAMWNILQAQQERERNEGVVNDARGNALSEITGGVDRAVPLYEQARSGLDPWAQQGMAGYRLFGDSLGINGADGNASAHAAFRSSPGYERQVEQGSDAVARKQSALGMLGSGNTQTAIADYARGEADKDYKNWQSGLMDTARLGYGAAGTQAGIATGIGDMYANAGSQRAGTFMNAARMLTGNNDNYLSTITQQGSNAGKAGQDALANNLNFGLNLGSTILSAVGGGKKAGLF